MQDKRVHQGIDREVVLLARVTHEAASIVQMNVNASIVVGPVRMMVVAERLDARVDLHGIDMTSAAAQRRGYVVSAAGTDDHDLLERRRSRIAREEVWQEID